MGNTIENKWAKDSKSVFSNDLATYKKFLGLVNNEEMNIKYMLAHHN